MLLWCRVFKQARYVTLTVCMSVKLVSPRARALICLSVRLIKSPENISALFRVALRFDTIPFVFAITCRHGP